MRPTTAHSFIPSPNVLFTLFFFLLASLPSGYAARNISIDDTLPDTQNGFQMTYKPDGLWEASTCANCNVAPNPSLAFSGTYHNALIEGETSNANVSVQVPFAGTAVYVFMAVPDRVGTPPTNCTFSIDGQNIESFSWSSGEGGGEQDYIYGMQTFFKEGLSNGNHTLVVSSTGQNRRAYLNIDRVVYTLPEDGDESTSGSPSPSASPVAGNNPSSATSANRNSTPIIIGAVVGGLVFLVLLGLLLILWRRRRANRPVVVMTEPFPAPDNYNLEKGISLAKVDSKASSVDSVSDKVPELHMFSQPKYPGGYVPSGVSMPPQAPVRKDSQPESPLKSASLTSRMSILSSLSGYDILRRASSRFTSKTPRVGSKLQISAPTLDEGETRKAKIREFERQQWKLRMDIKELEEQLESMTDEREKERLRIRLFRLNEDMLMLSVQQQSLADAPVLLESPTKESA